MQKNWSYRDKSKFGVNTLPFLLIFTIFFYGQIELLSQSEIGGGSEIYLMRDFGSRAIAMAGAYSAVSDDPSTILYNPAGLSFYRTEPTFSIYAGTLGLGRTANFLGYAQQISDEFGIGIGLNSLYTGSFTARDKKAEPIGEMSNFQYTLITAGSYRTEFASFGIALKYLTNNLIGSYTEATGFAFDVGTKFNVLDLFSFSLGVRNVYGTMMWNTLEYNRETIPFEIRTGIAMQFGLNAEITQTRSTLTGELEEDYIPATRYILLSIESSFIEKSKSPLLMIGAEIVPDDYIAFRGGFDIYGEKFGTPQLFPFNKWGVGVSIRPDLVELFDNSAFTTSLEYTISNELLSPSKIAHHLSLTFIFE